MKNLLLILLFIFVNQIVSQSENPEIPKPSPAQLAWQEAELGVIFHYDLHVFDNQKYNQRKNRITPIEDYNIFNPTKLNTDQWIQAAKNMGARFALLTVTHETGFALYPSEANPYNTKLLKWRDGKGDIVKDFVKSCRKFGIKPGLYVGIRWNSLLGVNNFKIVEEGEFGKNRQVYYNQMVEKMVTELCTWYGDLFEIWFDGGASSPKKGAPNVLPIVEKYQPNCLFYHNSDRADARWGGSESGTVAYPCWATFPYPSTDQEWYSFDLNFLKTGDPNGKYWMPAMSDAPLRGFNGRHEWFWEPGDENHIYPLESLINMYYKSVGRNSTLILGITPDPSGLIPKPDVQRMKEFGDEIERRFGKPIKAASGGGNEIILILESEQPINHVSIMENIIHGERVRKFDIKVWEENQWIKLVSGSCIGHKYIQKFESIKTEKLRLRILDSVAKPKIKDFSVYFVN